MSCRDDNNRPLHEKVIAAFQTFDPSLIALADAAEDAQTSALVLVHKEGTQNQNAAEKRGAISVANEKTFKSRRSDQ
jgi:hypothetical protein